MKRRGIIEQPDHRLGYGIKISRILLAIIFCLLYFIERSQFYHDMLAARCGALIIIVIVCLEWTLGYYQKSLYGVGFMEKRHDVLRRQQKILLEFYLISWFSHLVTTAAFIIAAYHWRDINPPRIIIGISGLLVIVLAISVTSGVKLAIRKYWRTPDCRRKYPNYSQQKRLI